MAKTLRIAAYFIFCLCIVAFAIRAGQRHQHCRECDLGFGVKGGEYSNFAGK